MARLAEGECSASECSLIGNDYWSAGYGRIIMVPRVKLAYDKVRRLEYNRLCRTSVTPGQAERQYRRPLGER